MKLLYTSDLHGHARLYQQLIEAAGQHKPDVVVLGGDLLLDDPAMQPDTFGRNQPVWVCENFRGYIEAVREKSGCRDVLVVFGNHDWSSSVPAMEEIAEAGLVTILDHKRIHEIDGLSFVGYPCTPPTPWYVKDFERLDQPGDAIPLLGGARWDPRFSRASSHSAKVLYSDQPTLEDELAELNVPGQPWVFAAHAPPANSKLDHAFSGDHYGSRAVRKTIEETQPLLSLHGHIHESPRVSGAFNETIGKTTAVNVGQSESNLSLALIEIDIASGSITQLERQQQS